MIELLSMNGSYAVTLNRPRCYVGGVDSDSSLCTTFGD